MNFIKKWIYKLFVHAFGHHWRHPLFIHVAYILQKCFGLARYNYFGITVLAGPVNFLDRMIIMQQEINPFVMQGYAKYLQAGDVFLDIGANHGVVSLLAAKNPDVSVFAFEPSRRELNRFFKNMQLNPSNNINILSYGLSHQDLTQELCIFSPQNQGKNSLPSVQNTEKKERCHFRAVTHVLSDCLLQKTKLCKIDVEGQELFVLLGLQSILPKLTHCVFVVEITPVFLHKLNLTVSMLYQFFSDFGFEPQVGYKEALFQWDEVFIHPERSSLR